MENNKKPILKVENLAISYETRKGEVDAVRNVSFEIVQGQTHGLVGESGCGKSTVAFGLIGLTRYNKPLLCHFLGFTPTRIGCSAALATTVTSVPAFFGP